MGREIQLESIPEPEIEWDGLLVRLRTLRSGGVFVPGKIQPNDGAERLLFLSPFGDLFLVNALNWSMSGGTGSLMNSGRVRIACGSALKTSGGTDSRMNSGRVRRVSGLFVLLSRTAS